MTIDEEGIDFSSVFRDKFVSAARTEERLKAERRAGMTPRQRAKRAKKTESLNFRCSPEVRALAATLAEKLDCGLSDVLERAVLDLAAKEKVQAQK